jgi:hypothetical protein
VELASRFERRHPVTVPRVSLAATARIVRDLCGLNLKRVSRWWANPVRVPT